jgi:hypothetical protein
MVGSVELLVVRKRDLDHEQKHTTEKSLRVTQRPGQAAVNTCCQPHHLKNSTVTMKLNLEKHLLS